MDESEENISTEDVRGVDSPFSVKSKPKKRSLVERELETNLTSRVTSPVTGEGTSTSRYGRARRLKTDNELESEKLMKPLRIDTKTQPQAYKMHASNSPIRKESPKRAVSVASSIENQIENIYNENMSLSRFGSTDDAKPQSPAKKFTKVYIRKDLIQKPDTDTVVLIKNMFSPVNKSSHLNNILERSSEKYSLNGHGRPRNGFPDTSSVVKTLDFDGKKKKESMEKTVAKNELFVLEAGCDYQVGDLAWARVGTYPFWPCIVTREPFTDMFVKKKMFGRVEHDVIHVTFFGDNGRRGWIVDNMLRKFHGRPEFEGARAKFTPEMKKKDPRLYAAHFVSEKKLALWNISVDEAETLMREPKRLRIDILYEMLENARAAKTTPKRERSGKITRTDSDVSLSESLYDTLFSEDDAKADDSKRTKKPRNTSLDVSEVVTACLDNMAAKTGIIKIQKQSHMDRWLQKAKSKTPEKTQPKILVKVEKEKKKDKTKKKQKDTRKCKKNECLSSEKNLLAYQNEHDYSSVNYENHDINDSSNINTDFEESGYDVDSSNIEVTAKIESLSNDIEDCTQEDIITTIVSDDIVMNDLENITKVENYELVSDCPEMTKETAPDSNETNVENKCSSNETKASVPDSIVTNIENKTSLKENEQIELKVELPENDVLLNIGLQPRRSKRKRQSDVEKKNSSIVKNVTEESKLESVQAMPTTDDELTVSDRNIVNSNSDHRENVLDRDKKDSTELNIDTVIKEEDDPVVSEVDKDTTHNKEDNPSAMIPLNAPEAVVVMETDEINKEDEPVVSEVNKDTTKHNKEGNHSATLPLKAPRAVFVTETDKIIKEEDPIVPEVNKDTTKHNKEHKHRAMLPLNAPRAVVVIEKDTIIEDDPAVSEVDKNTTKHNKKRNHSATLLLKASKALVVTETDKIIKEDDPVVPKVDKSRTKRNKKQNHSATLPLKAPRAEVVVEKDTIIKEDDPVVSNVDKDTTKHKEGDHSDFLPLNDPKAVVVIETDKIIKDDSVVSEVNNDTTKHNKVGNHSDLLPLNGPRAMVVTEKDTIIKEDDQVVLEVGKDTTKHKEHKYGAMLPLNAPRPVVVIEQLKMECFESLTIVNPDKLKKDTDLCKLKEDVITSDATVQKSNNKDNIANSCDSPVVNSNSNFSETNAYSSSPADDIVSENLQEGNSTINSFSEADKPVVTKASAKEEIAITEDIDKEINQDKILSMPVNKLCDAANDVIATDMDVDETSLHHNETNEIENVEFKSICSEDSDLPLSNFQTNLDHPPKADADSLFSNEEKSEMNEKLNVVIGEEMYVFDRTLSQDYDEIEPDVNKETNDLVTASNNDKAKNDLNSAVNNVPECERTLSPVYDDIDMGNDENAIEKCDEKCENKIANDDQVEPAPEINTETVINGAESGSQVFYGASVHKSKEKVHTQSQLNSIKTFPMVNGDHKIVSDDMLDNSNKIQCSLEKEETSNDDQISEPKTKKRSPKLSLKKVKDQKSAEINEVKSDDTVSTKSIFVNNNLNKDKATNKHLKDNNEPCDAVCNGLDFEMLIDMERTKQDTPKINGFVENKVNSCDIKPKDEVDADTVSMKSEDSGVSITKRKIRSKEKQDLKKGTDDVDFLKYLEIRQDALIDEHPELTHDEIVTYLYQTWLYEESNKSDRKKTDDAEQSNLVKGLNQDPPPPKKMKKKPKVEKETKVDIRDLICKDKPKRKATQSKPYYNEEFSDLEEEDLETFSIFDKDAVPQNEDGEEIDEVELYFEKLTKPKPNVFKGYIREKVCEICEKTGNLVKCKNCHGSFHVDCVKKEDQVVEVPVPSNRGRRKKKKPRGRKPKGYDESLLDSESQSDEKSQDANLSEEFNMSIEDEESHITVDAANFEAQLELKMKELQVDQTEDFESDQEIFWDAPPGQCEIIDVKHKEKPIDYSDFKCQNCEKYDTPVCFVCRSNKSPKTLTEARQKCQVAHCHRYYHLECLEYWPQTQFNSWEPSKTNKKVIEYIEALSCPRHVCHTCVSDDPRGCKTRFCGDKLARCVKCPATYHSFTKCLPAGTQILTGSQIICPRHYEHKAGKVPCHVNTGWCFICALGGTLICCEYCPTSFHAECLNIKPPEGSYMCEDCETGRLPLYGEMVWVKLGHYRWWPGIVLHPTEIPENIMAVKHSPSEFVVRFFGQYDHYWVNRGRVFPFQEGDSGKISSQKSKIDAAFTTAMEHAQRACEILKNVEPNEEEDMDIASSLLPPHYVKLKANKPVGSLTARRDIDANSLTQCDCDPKQPDPCGPYSHCLNRMLLTECGPLCRAGDNCNNRAFERRDYPRLAAYRTPQRGWGLKTLEDIRQGQFVIEYVGELIDEEEFRRRMRRKHEIRDENFYFLTLDKERMIDAGPKGNLARFMNHCCEPNCETQKWTVLGDVRVGLFALRDIPANSEVTFNYNLECAGIEKKRCLCGAKRCSGYIGAKPKQEEAQPKKLKGPGKRTYKKRKHLEESPSTSKVKPPIKIKIKPIKPRELTEIEKDLLIIKNATNGMSSDSDSRVSSVDEKKDTRALKRKRVCFSTDESGTSGKKIKMEDSED